MDIHLGVSFHDYAKKRNIPESSAHFQKLKQLYDEIQNAKELITQSYQIRPVGRETALIYFKKLMDLGIEDSERTRMADNVIALQEAVDSYIEKARRKEAELIERFEKVARSI